MAVTLDQIRRITIQATSTGTSAVAADLDRIATGQERVAATADGMVKATETTSRSVLSAAKQFDALNRSIDPVAKAQATLDRGTRLANAALAQGAIDAAAHGRAISILEQRLIQAGAAHREVGEATSLNRIQQMELMHVSKSLFDQLAAGQSPMRALSLEGGRIAEIFSMGQGGVGGTMKAMAGSFLGMLSPMALVSGGLLGIGAAAAYAVNAYEEGQRKLEAATNGVGRASGLTLGNLNTVADRGAAAGGLSRGDAHDLAGTFNATGRIGAALSTNLITTTRRYSEITGQGTADAGAELAKAFADPIKGADLLNDKLGLLNDRTRELVRVQAASGDMLGAQTALFDAYNRDVASAIDHTTALGRVWRSIRTGVSDTLFGVGEGISQTLIGTDAETNLRRADRDRRTGAVPTGIGDDNMFPSADDMVASPREEAKKWSDAFIAAIDEVPKALRAQKVIEDNRLSIEAGDAIRKAVPDIGRRMELETSRDSLSKIMGNEDALSNLSATAREELPRAFDILNEKLRNFSTAAQITATDSAFAVRSLLARSAAERAAVEVQRTYTDAIRDGDQALAKAKAAAKLDEMVASGQKAIMDDARRSDQEHALIGLRPYERNLAEVQQRHDNLLRDNAIDASTAATIRLTNALDKVAEAVSGKASLPPIGPAGALPSFAGGDAEAIIRATAPKYGIDPTTAMRVFGRESGMSTAAIGDGGSSFGAFQMHYGGIAPGGNRVAGMGDDYTRLTGFKAGDGVHTQAEADFAFSQIARSGGWGAFHAAAAVGVGLHEGIGSVPATYPVAIPSGGAVADRSLLEKSGDATAGKFTNLLTDADVQLNVMNQRLALQAKLTGQSSDTIESAMKMQTLLDEAYQRGAIPLAQYTRGILDQGEEFRKLGEREEARARAEADRRRAATAVDAVHGEFTDAASTISSDLLTRKYAGQTHVLGRIMGDVGQGLSQKLISSGIGQIGNGLFGQSGSPGGLLGGGIASLFGGGASSVGTVDLAAQTVNLSGGGALGSVRGGGLFGGGSSGGLFGGLFGSKPYINPADDAAQDAAQDAAGGGGLLSGLASIFHSGGTVGGDTAMRLVNVEAFRNAPRYHGGMGLAHDERRAILQTGEGVMSRSDMAGLRQSIAAAKSTAAAGARSVGGNTISIAGSTVVVQGNADDRTIGQISAELDRRDAKMMKHLDRHLGDHSQAYSALKG